MGVVSSRIGLLREDTTPIGDPRADDERVPFLPGHAHALALQHLDDHRIALRAEIAAGFVAPSPFERPGAGPVEGGGGVARGRPPPDRPVAPPLPGEPPVPGGLRISPPPPSP